MGASLAKIDDQCQMEQSGCIGRERSCTGSA